MARVPVYSEETVQQLLLENLGSDLVDDLTENKIKSFSLPDTEGEYSTGAHTCLLSWTTVLCTCTVQGTAILSPDIII